ncbi:MAG: CopG family transcriptional regulator, partial [Gemmatimonadales bacterium]
MPKRVKEPVQVYLDKADRVLLDRLAEEQGLSRAEVLRRGIRHLASEHDRGPLHYLIGIIDDPN